MTRKGLIGLNIRGRDVGSDERITALTQASVPNRPVRTPGPWRPIVPSVPGRVGKDGLAKRPSSKMTAVL